MPCALDQQRESLQVCWAREAQHWFARSRWWQTAFAWDFPRRFWGNILILGCFSLNKIKNPKHRGSMLPMTVILSRWILMIQSRRLNCGKLKWFHADLIAGAIKSIPWAVKNFLLPRSSTITQSLVSTFHKTGGIMSLSPTAHGDHAQNGNRTNKFSRSSSTTERIERREICLGTRQSESQVPAWIFFCSLREVNRSSSLIE